MEPPGTRASVEGKRGVRAGMSEARVALRKDLTPDLWRMWLEPEAPYPFKPGQYCTIGLEGVERAYSIVSAPHEPSLELFIELVPEGELTPRLHKLRPGDTVSLRPRAKGVFTVRPAYTRHLMVSTVTGIVPYISILRDHFHRGQQGHQFYLLHGASYQDELVFDQELYQLAEAHPDVVKFVPTVSRPQEARNSGWKGETGRVNSVVGKYIERFGLRAESTLIYACGHPGMIEAVKEEFAPRGFKVQEERFWKQ